METHYESKDERPPSHSEARQIKGFQQTLNSINAFILLIVM